MSEKLSVFTWNVRGLNAPACREAVRSMIQSVNQKLVCLQETKLSHISPQLATETLGSRFNEFRFQPANGTRGGIMLEWNSEYIQATDLRIERFTLSMIIRPTWEVSPFLLTVVYGPSEDSEKADCLDLLLVSPSSQLQGMVLGDFNLISEERHKNNSNLNRQLMGRFRHTLDRCELFEIALQNRRYTWSNERVQPTLVQLDRVFCNRDWELMHGDFMLQALSSSLSDHCPLLLSHQEKPVV
jgi:endonuclease/exonuclease/phosphatase family metal-dependent hydrolase